MARHCVLCGTELFSASCLACARAARLSPEEAAAKFAEMRRIVGRDLEREAERAAIVAEGR